MFSGAHLLLQVGLARYTTPESYGVFAIAFAAFLFLAGFYQALLLEPMSVLGALRDPATLDEYFGRQIVIHLLLTVPAGLLVAAVAFVPRGGAHFRAAALGLALSLPCILLFWLMRGAAYLKGEPGTALRGSAAYAGAVAVLLALRVAWSPPGSVGPADAFLVLGASGLIASAAVALALRPRRPRPAAAGAHFREHWAYGRWIAVAYAANGLSTLLITPFLGAFAGVAQSGAFRGLQNLTQPLQQLVAGGAQLALPNLSRHSRDADHRTFRRSALLLVGGTGLAAAAYAGALVLLGPWLLHLLYRSPHYVATAALLPLLAATLVVATLAQALSYAQRAAGRPDAVMWGKCVAALTVIGVGWVAIRARGLAGAIETLLASAAADGLTLLVLMWWGAERPSHTRPAGGSSGRVAT